MNLTASPPYVLATLSALEATLADLGGTVEPGAGVAAAQRAFAGATASAPSLVTAGGAANGGTIDGVDGRGA
jgi:hypothetical protein